MEALQAHAAVVLEPKKPMTSSVYNLEQYEQVWKKIYRNSDLHQVTYGTYSI